MNNHHYLPLTDEERREMLDQLDLESVEALFSDIPAELRKCCEMQLPPPLSEREAEKHLGMLAALNKNLDDYACFLGGGVYDHFIPAVVKHITGRSEFYTSYTPYQAEISQGLLQAIYEYQTMICQLTGMEVANASLYDGASAAAEAAVMACGVRGRSRVLVSRAVNPVYRQVMKTYFKIRDLKLVEVPLKDGKTDLEQAEELLDDHTAALVMQTPNFFGILEQTAGVAHFLHNKKGLLVVCVDPLSLPLVQAPSEYGADIVIGEGQGLGNPPSFGGPLLGFFATRREFIRRIPGRLVGETVDREGRRGYVMTLQTREQHIRRERATSNICSNQALNALAAAVYMASLGPRGMREVALLCMQKAVYTCKKIASIPGFELAFEGPFFKEFPVFIPGEGAELNIKLLEYNILGGLELGRFYPELKNTVLFSVTENRSREEIDMLVKELEGWK